MGGGGGGNGDKIMEQTVQKTATASLTPPAKANPPAIVKLDQIISGTRQTNVSGRIIENTSLDNVDFSESEMRGVTFKNCHGNKTSFYRAKAANITFIDCTFTNPNLIYANFTDGFFINCIFENPEVNGTSLLRGHIFNSHFIFSATSFPNGNNVRMDLSEAFVALTSFVRTDFPEKNIGLKLFNTSLAGCLLRGYTLYGHYDFLRSADFSALDINDTRLSDDEKAIVKAFGQWVNRADAPDYLKCRPDLTPKQPENKVPTVFSGMRVQMPDYQETRELAQCRDEIVFIDGYNKCETGKADLIFPRKYTDAARAERDAKEREEAERKASEAAQRKKEADERRAREEEERRVAAEAEERRKAEEAEAETKRKEDEERRSRTALTVLKPAEAEAYRVAEIAFDPEWMEKEMAGLSDGTISYAAGIGAGLQRVFAQASGLIAHRAVATLGRQSRLQEIVASLNNALETGNMSDLLDVSKQLEEAAGSSFFGGLFGFGQDKKKKKQSEKPAQPVRSSFEIIGDMLKELPAAIEAEREENSKNLDDFERSRKYLEVMETVFAAYIERLEKEQKKVQETDAFTGNIVADRVTSLRGSANIVRFLKGSVEMYLHSSLHANNSIQWLHGVTIPLINTHFSKMAALQQLANSLKVSAGTAAIDQRIATEYAGLIDASSNKPVALQVQEAFARVTADFKTTLSKPTAELTDARSKGQEALNRLLGQTDVAPTPAPDTSASELARAMARSFPSPPAL